MKGFVYILHFDEKYKGAQHYLGATTNLDRRLGEHRSGRGNGLIKAVLDTGTPITLTNVIDNDDVFKLEKQIKKSKNNKRMCPVCAGLITLESAKKIEEDLMLYAREMVK